MQPEKQYAGSLLRGFRILQRTLFCYRSAPAVSLLTPAAEAPVGGNIEKDLADARGRLLVGAASAPEKPPPLLLQLAPGAGIFHPEFLDQLAGSFKNPPLQQLQDQFFQIRSFQGYPSRIIFI